MTKSVTYSYYDDGLLATSTTYTGQTISYGYDADLRLVSQTDPNDPNPDKTIRYGYDTRSRRTSITYPSGVSQRQSYDKAGRVAEILLSKSDATMLQDIQYDYGLDAAGNLTSSYKGGNVIGVSEKTSGLTDSTVSYGYDQYERLTSATRTGQNAYTQSYTYDSFPSFLFLGCRAVGTTTYSYTYDRDGNLGSYRGLSLTNDATNKTVGGTLSNGTSLSFEYDGLGRRVSRTVGSSRCDYWYDQSGLSLESGAKDATYLRDPSGRMLSIESSAGFLNYGMDRLGSTTANINSTGDLRNTYRYDPWGNRVGVTGSTYAPVVFTGSFWDYNSTGLYLMGQRYYQNSTGRFTQPDPRPSSVFEPNRYEYAGDNPVNATDPSGMWTCYTNYLDCASNYLGGLLDQASASLSGNVWSGGDSGGGSADSTTVASRVTRWQ